MKVSVNWIKQYLDFELPPIEELVEHIGSQLGGIDGVENIGLKYSGAVIAKVIRCEPHADSDHLNVCHIDDGGKTSDVTRGEDGFVQVVCGAPNVTVNMMVVWLPPGTTVPDSFDKDPFVLGSRELRGVMSNGMLASARELALGDDHDGILEVDANKIPGTPFAEAYQLDDIIIDIENKMFTHRPDCFGQIGIAREIAGILGQQFTSPDWYLKPELEQLVLSADPLPLDVQNELPGLVPRFVAVALGGVHVQPSPLDLRTWLLRVGVRPINNVVDVTNFMMLETGQPLHAYDYDKLCRLDEGEKATLVVRHPRGNEAIELLNGKNIEPRQEAIVISTETKLVGIAGVMGGSDSEVDYGTTRIVLEAATFDMYSIRRTSMTHGLFTDAVTRFNKGQSPLQNDEVAARAVELFKQLSGARVASELVDINHTETADTTRRWVHPPVVVDDSFINNRLGLRLAPHEIKVLLENVEFSVQAEGEQLLVTAPYWRTDVETREDVVEEVGRLYGFDKLPLELPRRSIQPVTIDPLLGLKDIIRRRLAKAGANEVLNYTFVHGDLLDKVGQNKDLTFKLSNALSPDLQHYRLSLMPSLLTEVHPNIKTGYDSFALFELGKAHVHGENDAIEPDIPKEVNALSYIYAAKRNEKGAPYYQARLVLMDLLAEFQIDSRVRIESLEGADLYGNPWLEQMSAPFEPSRSAIIRDISVFPETKNMIWGIVGEFKPAVRKALKLPAYTAGFELDPLLFSGSIPESHYVTLSRYPGVTQDITVKVSSGMTYRELYEFISEQLNSQKEVHSRVDLQPLGIYQRQDDLEHKQVTFRVVVTSYEKTLTDKEVSAMLTLVMETAKDKLSAEQV